MNILESFINENAIPDYSMKLLKLSDAIKFVKLCRDEDVILYGFDGFYLRPDGVQIEQSLSADYSKYSKKESYNFANKFFTKQSNENIGYEMVYEKR